ncbi:MAG: OmpA family protein [Flavobacteriales bacterium]
MINRLLSFLCVSIFLVSCVSPKVFNELKDQQNSTKLESQAIKKENILLETENTELLDKIESSQALVDQLKKDTTEIGLNYRKILSSYNDLSNSYDLLSEKNSRIISKKVEESRRLLEELQIAKDDLQQKEDKLTNLQQSLTAQQKRLLITQSELESRELKVTELQSIINKKDSVLLALKERISAALLGFEGDGLTITQKNGKVYISLEEKLLFASGSWTIDTRGEEALSKLAKSLESQKDINVLIEGHTDNIPFGGRGQIKDNWDLSVVRATAIVRIITSNSNISMDRLTAAGRGEFVPIAENTTKEGRRANRRIEIILTPKLDDLYQLLEN